MAHHAYFYAGDIEEGIAATLRFAKEELGLEGTNNPDLLILRYGLFSVEDARLACEQASRAPLQGSQKLIIIAAGRMFHEAQNALLKTFEEPPEGTTLVLVVPSEGTLIETLRSRVLSLAGKDTKGEVSSLAKEFLSGSSAAREKIVAKILERAKSDDAKDKQAARLDALSLAEGLLRAAHKENNEKGSAPHRALLEDLTRLIPILHERSAPLKPILEHIMLVTPKGIDK